MKTKTLQMRYERTVSVACALLCSLLAGAQASSQELSIEVLSSFPELVTGGDALVSVSGAESAPSVMVAGRNVSSAFVADGSGVWIGSAGLPWRGSGRTGGRP